MPSKILNILIFFIFAKEFEGKTVPIETLFQNHSQVGIINGNEAIPNQFPYHIGIVAWFRELTISNLCGGSLISDKSILTSGNCLKVYLAEKVYYPDAVIIYYGCHKMLCKNFTSVLNKSLVVIHPVADIALVNLDTPLKIGDAVKPIALDFDNKDHVNEKATLTGWGFTKIVDDYVDPNRALRYVDLKVISNEECAKKYKDIKKDQICTGASNDEDQNVGFCFGDHGGPLVSNGKQIGIASFHSEFCKDPTYPAGFTRVAEFKDWIGKNSLI